MNATLQRLLITAYSTVKRSGVLRTSLGKAFFRMLYFRYKTHLEARDVKQLQPLYRPDSLAIDVGANIGFFTEQFGVWARKGRGRVLAIEPELNNFRQLERRIKKLNMAGFVELVHAAAADVSGELRLSINPDHPGDHQLGEAGVPVTAVTIDELMEERRWPEVSLIKIDVQGAETRVIEGARETLGRYSPSLYVEVSEADLHRHGSSVKELTALLLSLGYEVDRDHKINESLDRNGAGFSGYTDVLFSRTAHDYEGRGV